VPGAEGDTISGGGSGAAGTGTCDVRFVVVVAVVVVPGTDAFAAFRPDDAPET
jgi:hypothetical protein